MRHYVGKQTGQRLLYVWLAPVYGDPPFPTVPAASLIKQSKAAAVLSAPAYGVVLRALDGTCHSQRG